MSQSRKRRLQVFVACALALLAWRGPAAAQQTPIRGTVVNEGTNEPVASANVVVKGTRIGVLTGANGEFALRVRSLQDTLVVSSVGFANATVPLAGRAVVTVRLEVQAVLLEQVVAVGYGTQKRADVTGSVASVNSERLQTQPTANVAEALQGAVAGLSVTTPQSSAEGSFDILIRGRNSINASNTPLVIVDGIPYGGNFSEINPSDIQSLDVLKDASAAAIYGARGSNGVILITTRNGRGKPKVTYSGHVGTSNMVNLPRMMNGQEFADFKCVRVKQGQNCETAFTASEWANLQAGKFTDWVTLATRTGVQQEHTVSFGGGSAESRYYIAGSLLDNQGIAKNDNFRRYNLRVNLEQQMNSWLKMGTNTQMGLVNRSGLEASFSDAFFQNPLTTPYNADGSLTIYPWPEDVFFANPLEGLAVKDDDNSRRIFTSNHLDVTFPFMEGLSYRLNGGIDFEDRQRGRFYGRNTKTGTANQGLAQTYNTHRFDWTLENVLRYQKSFGKHNLDLTALYSQEGNKYENNGLQSTGFPNDVLTYYQANVAALITPSYTYQKSGLTSQMARLNYTVGDRYLMTATARRDGFSGFGQNHKYGVFPSFALGWNIAKESFWPLAGKVDAFKLRLSWGKNGNEAISPYRTMAQLGTLSYIDGTVTAPGYIPTSLANPDLRWEATSQTDAGADFGFLNNRVQGSLDFYWSQTHDLLLNRSISPVHGINSVLQNLGKTANRGVELSLNTNNIQARNFSWKTTLNVTANRNKIVDLYGDGNDDLANGWFIGHPIDVNYDYQWEGIWQTGDNIAGSAQPTAKPGDVRVRDVNGDGKITADDRIIQGSLEPSWAGGLTNTMKYRGVTLAVFINTMQGVRRPNPLMGSNLVFPEVRRNTLVHNYWSVNNPSTEYPANREGQNPLALDIYENSSFVRLQDVTLGWDVPQRLAGRYGLENLRVYVDGKNLWTGTQWSGLDPEFTNSHQRDIPQSRAIIFGLDVAF